MIMIEKIKVTECPLCKSTMHNTIASIKAKNINRIYKKQFKFEPMSNDITR